jgi:hypothetical protein
VVVLVVAVAALLMVSTGCSDSGRTAPVIALPNNANAVDAVTAVTPATGVDLHSVPGTVSNDDGPGAGPAPDPENGDMSSIRDGLGYALVPALLPLDSTLATAELVKLPSKPLATVFYTNGGQRLSLFYPADFIPDFDEQTPSAGTFSPPPPKMPSCASS